MHGIVLSGLATHFLPSPFDQREGRPSRHFQHEVPLSAHARSKDESIFRCRTRRGGNIPFLWNDQLFVPVTPIFAKVGTIRRKVRQALEVCGVTLVNPIYKISGSKTAPEAEVSALIAEACRVVLQCDGDNLHPVFHRDAFQLLWRVFSVARIWSRSRCIAMALDTLLKELKVILLLTYICLLRAILTPLFWIRTWTLPFCVDFYWNCWHGGGAVRI